MFANEGGQKHLVRNTKGQWSSQKKDGYSKASSNLDVSSICFQVGFSSIRQKSIHTLCVPQADGWLVSAC